MTIEHIETAIIGAGQAGLATAYHLQRQGRPCLILDGNEQVGDNWRADVEGAKTLGLTAIWFQPPEDEPVEAATDTHETTGPVAPDYSITQIPQLLDLPIFQGNTHSA